jgi:predicted enzyme related to lactoylglutathione lyase
MPRVIHFEITVDDPERAIEFYKKVFGWDINKWGPIDYWLIKTGEDKEPGINGAIMPKETSYMGTINTISVNSVDVFIEKIKSNGGKIIREKTVIPGIGYFAYCQDTEGNVFGIMQEDHTVS